LGFCLKINKRQLVFYYTSQLLDLWKVEKSVSDVTRKLSSCHLFAHHKSIATPEDVIIATQSKVWLVGLQTGTLWKSIWKFLRKLEIDLPEDPAIPFLGICLKDAQPCHRGTCSTMFITSLFVIARSWKQTRCPTTEDWIQKMWFIYTMEYYSAIKNEDILSFAGKWMEVENIILSEVTQTQKDLHGMYSQISTYLLISQTNKQAIKQYRIPKIQSTELKQVNSILKRGKIPLFKS
jgi:hypothetical protein